MSQDERSSELRAHAHETGTIEVPHSVDRVFPLLTPEGERTWIDGWAPTYPASAAPSETPGTVFLTSNHGKDAIWVIAEKDDERHRGAYAYVIPEVRATLVRVACDALGESETRVRIEYDVTALSEEGDTVVATFSAGFDAMLTDWRDAMNETLGYSG